MSYKGQIKRPRSTDDETIAILRDCIAEGIFPSEKEARKRNWHGAGHGTYVRVRTRCVRNAGLILPERQQTSRAESKVDPKDLASAIAEVPRGLHADCNRTGTETGTHAGRMIRARAIKPIPKSKTFGALHMAMYRAFAGWDRDWKRKAAAP